MPATTGEEPGKKRKRAVSINETDSSIRASAPWTNDTSTATMANENENERPKKRARGRPDPNSDAALERAAFDNILALAGILNVTLPQQDRWEKKSPRLRQYEYIANWIMHLGNEANEHLNARVTLEQALDDAKEEIEELEVQIAVRMDFQDLLEREQEKVEELEKEKKALEEQIANLRKAA